MYFLITVLMIIFLIRQRRSFIGRVPLTLEWIFVCKGHTNQFIVHAKPVTHLAILFADRSAKIAMCRRLNLRTSHVAVVFNIRTNIICNL